MITGSEGVCNSNIGVIEMARNSNSNNSNSNNNKLKRRHERNISTSSNKKRKWGNRTSWFEPEVFELSKNTIKVPNDKIVLLITDTSANYIHNPYCRILEPKDWDKWNIKHNGDINGRASKPKKIAKHMKNTDSGEQTSCDKTNNPSMELNNIPSIFDIIVTGIGNNILKTISAEDESIKTNDKQPKQKASTKMSKCNNPLCNHLSLVDDPVLPIEIKLTEIKDLDDLITLGKSYHCKKQISHRSLNLRLLNNLVPSLLELKDMIGMKDVKTRIVDQILFFLQGFNTIDKCGKCYECSYKMPCIQTNTDMLHTVITGPPGVGKTCLARILGKIYTAMGLLSNGEFHEVARSDFVAKYLGQTAVKTKELIEKCKGGVMFIDEAYSLGHKNKRDSFAKEALDTLNKFLSDEKDLLCIIAGYKKELDECFFAMNDGLKRRFTFRYDIDTYDYKELLDIFKLKVEQKGWSFDSDDKNTSDVELVNMFRKSKEYFPYSGGDIETLFLQCKIIHGRRMPLLHKKKQLTLDDIENGFKEFVKHRKYEEKKSSDDIYEEQEIPSMYNI
jgi:hypothetical protein